MSKICGKTIIELSDVNTGEKRIYEDTNLVTNALDHFFNDDPTLIGYRELSDGNNKLTRLYGWWAQFFFPLFKRLLGGVLLFSENLPEDPECIYAPANRDCVGYASVDSYSGTNTFRGNWNESESGELEDGTGYRFVWDFSTSQANSIISCVCLTTPFGGRFGYGMSPDTDHRETVLTGCSTGDTDGVIGPDRTDSIWYKIGPFWGNYGGTASNGRPNFTTSYSNYGQNDDIGWTVVWNDTMDAVVIKKLDISVTNVSLTRSPLASKVLSENTVPVSIVTDNCLSISQNLGNSHTTENTISRIKNYTGYHIHYGNFDFDSGENTEGYLYIYAFKCNANTNTTTAPVYQTVYVTKIDLDTFTVVYEKSFVVQNFIPTHPIFSGYSASTSVTAHCHVILNNTMYLRQYAATVNGITGDGYSVLKVDLENPTNQKIIDLPKYTNNTWNMSTSCVSGYSYRLFAIEGRVICPTGHIIDANDRVLFYPMVSSGDSSTNTNVSPIAATSPRRGNHNGKMFVPMTITKSGSSWVNDYAFYTPCLFTINNLENPVVKTADKTMKITYILREEAV